MLRRLNPVFLIILILALLLSACGSSAASSKPGVDPAGRLQVVATTTIVADVVRNIGGDQVDVIALLPPETDPHTFDPSPQDVAKVADADVVFANGAGLETFLKSMMDNAGGKAKVFYVSDGIQLLQAPDLKLGTPAPGEESLSGDPHTWFDPQNVMVWAKNIAQNLSAIDPSNAALYAQNASKYTAQLEDLDAWIKAKVSQIPAANRRMVTDHDEFTYFAQRYGFDLIGAVIPGYSTLAQPSARELAALDDLIRQLGVKAVFVGNAVNPALAKRVAQDTGVKLVFLYTGALSKPGGPASTYLDFMRYDVAEIVRALQ